MIFGVNFNGTPIPPKVRRKWANRIRITECGHQTVDRGRVGQLASCSRCHDDVRIVHAVLQGVAQSDDERNAMIVQGTNETRRLYTVPRQTAGGIWYGVYVYYPEHHKPLLIVRDTPTRE